jgi:hypothetical protein
MILDQACVAARTIRPLSESELQKLLAKTTVSARDGAFEPFKTGSIFDGTVKHPEWLGDEPTHVR